MKQIPKLVRDISKKTRGRVLIVGSKTSEQRERSTYHAICQAAQSSGIPCVPFSPPIREDEIDSSPGCLLEYAVDGLAMAKRTGCASVLVVGGGSTIEVAKSIAQLLTSGVTPQSLTEPSSREAKIRTIIQKNEQAAAPIIAVPTSFHGCVAASSNRTYLSDPLEGSVLNMAGDHLDRSGGVHVVIDPNLLRQSSPMTCAEGAISSLARLSDTLLVNEGGEDDIGRDDGQALGELVGSIKEILDISFDLYDQGVVSMASWKSKIDDKDKDIFGRKIEDEDICEQYGALGCVIGSCISLGGPGITHSIARVIASNYNVSFGQACALILPHIINIQMDRSSQDTSRNKNGMAAKGMKVHLENISFEKDQDGTMYGSFGRVRAQTYIANPSADDLKELTSAIMMDECFKQGECESGKVEKFVVFCCE